MEYIPSPINTTGVTLPPDLEPLLEKIAENTHEVWAANRTKDGWKYGTVRDDAKKEHPCLVPYSELPESEKEYDRNTSRETLALICKLGYSISRNERI